MSWIHALRERAADLFQSRRRERELSEEIGYHLEIETQKQIANGLDATSARALAQRRFGNAESVREATREERGGRMFSGSVQDVMWSIRSLRKHPGFTVLSLATLALGIGATTTAFAALDTVLLKPLPYRDTERLVVIEELTSKQSVLPPSHPNFLDWRDQNRSFDGVASEMYPFSATVTVGKEKQFATIMGVSRGFFAAIGMSPMMGREFTADENVPSGPKAVMVSYEFWKASLGAPASINGLKIDDDPIVGVLPRGFRLVGDAQLFFPHERAPGTSRTAHNYVIVGRLKSGATIESARADMAMLSQRLKTQHGDNTQAVNVKITPLHDYLFGNYRTLTITVFVAAALVLLVACTNLVSAQLARGFARARELSLRTALGASRGRLVRQLLIESGMLAIAGAIAGTLVAVGLTHLVRTLGVGLVPRLDELAINVRVLSFAALATAFTSIVIGVYPALRLSGNTSSNTLRSASHHGHSGVKSPVWSMLLGFEIAMAVVLLVGSAMLVRTLHNILANDIGFESRGVITAAFDPSGLAPTDFERIYAALSTLPQVDGVAYTNMYPLSWGNESAPVVRPSDAPNVWPAFAGFRIVSAEYFRVLRQPVLKGRAFTNADVAGSLPVAIITPGIAKALWPDEDPIGKQIRTNYLDKQWLTVVGVVAEASSWTSARGSQNEIYTSLAQQSSRIQNRIIAVVRAKGDTRSVLPVVRSRLREVAPAAPPKLGTMTDRIAASAADRRFAMITLGAFAFVAVVLVGIGIYGVGSYSVAARKHEIGVRLALGATPGGVQRYMMRGATLTAFVGVAVGITVCVFAAKLLQSMLYGVSRVDPVAYGIGASFLMLIALLSAYLPARRSSRADPVRAMRGE